MPATLSCTRPDSTPSCSCMACVRSFTATLKRRASATSTGYGAIAGGARHEIAGGVPGEEARREGLEGGVEVVAQIGLHALPSPEDGKAGGEAGGAVADREHDDEHDEEAQRRLRPLRLQGIDG